MEGRTEVPETGSGGSAARPFLPQGPRGAADRGVARGIAGATYLEFEEFQ